MLKKNSIRNHPAAQRNRLSDPGYWQAPRNELQVLIKQEDSATADSRDDWCPDEWLRAYVGPETDWKRKVPDGPEFRPRRLVYALGGGLDETFRERFRLVAIGIGAGLGAESGKAFDRALSYIFRDARKHGSLRMQGGGGGFIPRICVAALNTCLHLEQQAMERQAAEQQTAEASKQTKKRPGPRTGPLTLVVREILRKQPKLRAKKVCSLLDAKFLTDPKKYPALSAPTFRGKTYTSYTVAYSDPPARGDIDALVTRNRPQ